jgi:hypothetical protein
MTYGMAELWHRQANVQKKRRHDQQRETRMSNDSGENNRSSGSDQNLVKTGAAHAETRSWMKRHKLLTFAAVFLLAALVHFLVARPVNNPQPQKKLLVQGSFPYDRGWELKIEASYYSSNPTCRQTARAFFIFPQAEVTREAWRTVSVMRDGGNRYRFEFYEDAVLPGFCDWQLRFINYVIAHDSKEIQGGAILGFPGRFNVIRYSCSNVRMPNSELVLVGCIEGDDHWSAPDAGINQIDFVWRDK